VRKTGAATLDDIVVGTNELARVLDVTPRRVRKLAEEQKLPQISAGRFPLIACVQEHIRRLRAVQEAAASDLSEQEWRKRKVAAQAALAELDLAERQGQVTRIEPVDAAVVGLITVARNKFLGVPSFLAARMPQAVRAEVFKLAEEEVHRTLDELSQGGAEILAAMQEALAESGVAEEAAA
jgi:hypothetical protein